MSYTNSKLVTYQKISPNKNSPRNHAIDTITIHCMAGNLSLQECGSLFQRRGGASSNYGIDSQGNIGLYVEEKDRSWCSSSRSNDNRAITIEVANDGGAPDWHISDKAMKALISLCADICKRNNIKKLIWSTDKNTRVNHLNGCNMTVHRDYAAKSCPGNYIYSKLGYIAQEVNKQLNPIAEKNASANDEINNSNNTKIQPIYPSNEGKILKQAGFSKGIKFTSVAKSGLNIRVNPGLSSKSLGTISYGTRVMWYGYYCNKDNTLWKCIYVLEGNLRGKTGYVSSKYLK